MVPMRVCHFPDRTRCRTATVVAEISIDELPFRLFSQTVPPKADHIAKHDLHDDEARRIFFF
jgi:hypothetical protein